MNDHRITYYHHRLSDTVEMQRYTAADNSTLVIESTHATLSISRYPVKYLEDVRIFAAVAPDGTEGFIAKNAYRERNLHLAASVGVSGPGTVATYCPADEWGMRNFYLTVEDALVCHDPAALRREHERQRDMTARAMQAAAAIDGDDQSSWSRAAYEGACAAAGVPAADDATTQRISGPGGGVYSIPQYHLEHVVWASLAYRRAEGIADEVASAEVEALARADAAAGTGAYARDMYEAACAAAGATPLADAVIPHVTANHYLAPYMDVRDVLGEMESAAQLGGIPRTAATLASRRQQGMAAELGDQRARERLSLVQQGHVFASKGQVSTIMRLLANRTEGGGFFVGPTDREGVALLSSADADRYIMSLRGEY